MVFWYYFGFSKLGIIQIIMIKKTSAILIFNVLSGFNGPMLENSLHIAALWGLNNLESQQHRTIKSLIFPLTRCTAYCSSHLTWKMRISCFCFLMYNYVMSSHAIPFNATRKKERKKEGRKKEGKNKQRKKER